MLTHRSTSQDSDHGRRRMATGTRRAVTTAAASVVLLAASVAPAAAATVLPSGLAGSDTYRLPADASDDGSIVYIKNNNIFLSSPDMKTTVQVTQHGARQTADNTGAGYASVSQANDGLIVAVRNQTAPTGDIYGWIWILDRQGHVLDKFEPKQTQRAPSIGCASAPFAEYPQGITHVSVSPNGKRIAYLQQVDFLSYDCSAGEFFYTYVADIDGSHAVQITQNTDTGGSDIDFGQWTRNNQLLLDSTSSSNFDESAAMYYLDLPGRTAKYWVGPTHFRDPDWMNTYYQEPTLSHGRLASDGYVYDDATTTGWQALVLWSSSGPPAIPAAKCSTKVQASTENASVAWPDWSPDGSSLVFTESDGVSDKAGEGIYLMGVGSLANCGALDVPRLMVQGGSSPDWGPAGPTQPYFTDVAAGDQFYDDIMWLGENGVTTGYPDGTFRPGTVVSRQAMAAYLYRFAHDGSDAGTCGKRSPYRDVARGSGFCGDIRWLKTAGVTTGYSDGTFRPAAVVSRQAMAAYLHRLSDWQS